MTGAETAAEATAAPEWDRSLSRDEVLARRAAMVELMTRSLPAAGGPYRLVGAARAQIWDVPRLRVWALLWEPAGAAQEAGGRKLLGFALSGAARVMRIATDSKGGGRYRGDSLPDFLADERIPAGRPREEILQRIRALLPAERDRVKGRHPTLDVLGFGTPWHRGAHPNGHETLGYVPQFTSDRDAGDGPSQVAALGESSKSDLVLGLVGRWRAEGRGCSTPPTGSWHSLSDASTWPDWLVSFFERAGRELLGFEPPHPADPLELLWCDLPFYGNARQIEVRDRRPERERVSRFVARFGADATGGAGACVEIVPVDWSSGTIYHFNYDRQLALSQQDVAAYLVFFCQYLIGPPSPNLRRSYFRIVEPGRPLSFLGGHDQVRERVDSLVEPVRLYTAAGVEPAGESPPEDPGEEQDLATLVRRRAVSREYYLLSATVSYERSLFRSVFAVNGGGFVEMLDDQPLAGNLPITPEVISADSHEVFVSRHGPRS